MERAFTTAKLVTLAMFLSVSLGMIGYQVFWVWPAQHCDAAGAWWDPQDRQCLTPIPIERLTGRQMSADPAFRPVVPPAPAPGPAITPSAAKPAAR